MGFCPSFKGRFFDNSAVTPSDGPPALEKLRKSIYLLLTSMLSRENDFNWKAKHEQNTEIEKD